MPDISQFIASDNITYDLKDAKAREDLSVETTTISDAAIVSFTTKSAQNLTGLTVNINPVQDLHGYSNPWPAGGGKNLLLNTAESKTVNGVVWTVESDGAVTSTQRANVNSQLDITNSQVAIESLGLVHGQTYCISGCPVDGSSNTHFLQINFYDSTGTILSPASTRGRAMDIGNGASFTLDNACAYVWVFAMVRAGVAAPSGIWKPMIELGSSPTSFAPYSNICPISGWDGCTVERTGVNLWDEEWEIGTINNTTGQIEPDANNIRSKNFCRCSPSTDYYIKGVFTVRYYWYDEQYNFISGGNTYDDVITSPSNAVFFKIRSTANYGNVYNDDMGLNYPSTYTSYIPHSDIVTYSVSFPSSAGTVHGGYIEALEDGTAQLVVTDEMVTYNSSTGWTKSNDYFYITVPEKYQSAQIPLTNWLKGVAPIALDFDTLNPYEVALTTTYMYINACVPNMADISAWNTLLAVTPLQIIYHLATPVTYTLDPIIVKALLGQNNIWADSGNVSVIYRDGLIATLDDLTKKQNNLTFDDSPTQNSDNPVKSGGVWSVVNQTQGMLAYIESGSTASRAYVSGEYFCWNGLLYRATTNIASGASFTVNTNCEAVNGGGFNEFQNKVYVLKNELETLAQIADGTYQGVDLTTKFASEISAYTDPWAWIKARITAWDYEGLHVCDYIPFTTTESSAKTYNAQIAGINTYKGYGDTAVGNHIDFICKELWATKHPMNPVNFNNGTKFGSAVATEYPWLASDLYLYLNSLSGTVASAASAGGGTGTAVDYTSDGVYYYIPDALKAQIVAKRAYLPSRYNASSLLTDDNSMYWKNIGNLWLPSEFEVYGAPCWGGKGGYATAGNNIQYPIFLSMANRVKKCSGSRDYWWVLSIYSGNATYWCRVSNYGYANASSTSSTNATPVCFRIA